MAQPPDVGTALYLSSTTNTLHERDQFRVTMAMRVKKPGLGEEEGGGKGELIASHRFGMVVCATMPR